MSMGDIVWLFFIFSAVQPMLRQQMLEAMRIRKISQFERERKSRVILLVHRQETMRFLGFPSARYVFRLPATSTSMIPRTSYVRSR
jgi:ABC-type thiamine transport system ATPase subunit